MPGIAFGEKELGPLFSAPLAQGFEPGLRTMPEWESGRGHRDLSLDLWPPL
jgi:hypothetical protein